VPAVEPAAASDDAPVAADGDGASSAPAEQRLVAKPPLARRTAGGRPKTSAGPGRPRGKKQPAEVDMDQALQKFASCVAQDISELSARFVDGVSALLRSRDCVLAR